MIKQKQGISSNEKADLIFIYLHLSFFSMIRYFHSLSFLFRFELLILTFQQNNFHKSPLSSHFFPW
jgi:hypothetical protein